MVEELAEGTKSFDLVKDADKATSLWGAERRLSGASLVSEETNMTINGQPTWRCREADLQTL